MGVSHQLNPSVLINYTCVTWDSWIQEWNCVGWKRDWTKNTRRSAK